MTNPLSNHQQLVQLLRQICDQHHIARRSLADLEATIDGDLADVLAKDAQRAANRAEAVNRLVQSMAAGAHDDFVREIALIADAPTKDAARAAGRAVELASHLRWVQS